MFKVKDTNFNISYAYLDAFIDEKEELLNIGIKIETEKNNLLGSRAKFESEILLKIKPNIIKKWQDIVGKNIEWKEFPERGSKMPYAFLVIDDHEEIYNAKIEFKNINNKIYVKIKAFCDVKYINNYLKNTQLEIETEVDFFIIFCGSSKEEDCRNEIKPYLNIMDYKCVKSQLDVSILLPKDLNMEKFIKAFGEDYIV
jgi:hypothetical protein